MDEKSVYGVFLCLAGPAPGGADVTTILSPRLRGSLLKAFPFSATRRAAG